MAENEIPPTRQSIENAKSNSARFCIVKVSRSLNVEDRRMVVKALVYQGPGRKALEDRPKPKIAAPTDAIVKITKTTICGTDLHILKGDVPTCSPAASSVTKASASSTRSGPASPRSKPAIAC